MIALSRREFGKIVVAGVPVAAAFGSTRLGAAGHLTVGVSTHSFRLLPRVTGRDNLDEVIRAVQAVRATHIELAFANIEPAPPSVAPVMGGSAAYPRRVVLTPEEVAATNSVARAALRTWRAETPIGVFERVRGTLEAARLTVHACAIAYDDSFSDDEIEATFRQARALGVSTISSPMTMATAARLVPFAERHQVAVAIHNQVDGNAAGAIDAPRLEAALALSRAFRIKLDIGNLTASNRDAVADLGRYQTRVSHVLVRDRLRNGGLSQPFGDGDTPITGVLDVLRTSSSSIPALVEYDYIGLRSPAEEVGAALDYLAKTSRQ